MGASTHAELRGSALVDAIRDQIIIGKLAPGSRVTEPELAIQFGVSRVPVREALRALAAEGFVELRPYGSPTVKELTDQVAHDVRTARALLEPETARYAAMNRTDADLAHIEAILLAGEDAISRGQMDRLHRLNTQFHDGVASACGNEVLGGFVHQLSYRSEWINTAAIPVNNRYFWRDHREIHEAIAGGEADLAATLMAAHVYRAAVHQPGVADASRSNPSVRPLPEAIPGSPPA